MGNIKTYWDKSAGYKTASGGVLVLLFQLIKMILPEDALSQQWDEWILNAIGLLTATGLLDKVWRNRHKIKKFIINLLTKNK